MDLSTVEQLTSIGAGVVTIAGPVVTLCERRHRARSSRNAQATVLDLPSSPNLMVADAVPMHCATESSGEALLLRSGSGESSYEIPG